MAIQVPTVEQIRELPALLTTEVTDREIDDNGHMNVVHYLSNNIRAADILLRALGVDDNYRSERRVGLFTTEHHIAYHSELREGDSLSVHARIVDRGEKAVHMMTFLVDRGRARLSNTLEILLVHVDLDSRRSAPMPDDLALGLDELIAASGKLSWEAPVCGVMGIRR
ncbi:thioesterase family protein [Nocardia shimofusensis]|uniref:thioesterase family protein n=1 Tax=Nocardia shimofusensis TaxID=228596 RepID=UPI0008305499|nr:thioesterase family protein [Nocardia shimofusensis]